METKLELLTKIKKELDETLRNYRYNHALWAKWLHYARKDSEKFDDWCFEQAMKQSDLKADVRYISQEFKDVKPELKYQVGAIYYSERHSYHVKLDQLRLQRSNLLHDLWTERHPDGSWVYSLREIADAYGVSDDAMYKALRLNKWFHPRKSPGQTHIPKNHLKSIK